MYRNAELQLIPAATYEFRGQFQPAEFFILLTQPTSVYFQALPSGWSYPLLATISLTTSHVTRACLVPSIGFMITLSVSPQILCIRLYSLPISARVVTTVVLCCRLDHGGYNLWCMSYRYRKAKKPPTKEQSSRRTKASQDSNFFVDINGNEHKPILSCSVGWQELCDDFK